MSDKKTAILWFLGSAAFQSRFTVPDDTPGVAAVSAIVRPMK